MDYSALCRVLFPSPKINNKTLNYNNRNNVKDNVDVIIYPASKVRICKQVKRYKYIHSMRLQNARNITNREVKSLPIDFNT